MTPEQLADYVERLRRASRELRLLSDRATTEYDVAKLLSKAHGVDLALDYLRGYTAPVGEQ